MLTHRYRYDWVDFPVDPEDAEEPAWESDFAGFRAKILANPLRCDIEEERKARQAMREIKSAEAEAEYLRLIAPRIVAWEYETENITGEVVSVLPPAETWESFYVLPPGLFGWLLQLVPVMHLPKVRAIWLGDAGTTEKSTQTPIDPDPTPPPSS